MLIFRLGLALMLLSACQGPVQPPRQNPVTPALLQSRSAAGISHASRKLQNNLIGLFDKNSDGRLDQSELKIPLLLRLLDKNRDGFLTQDELQHPLADKAFTTFLRETAGKTFSLADRSKDKRLSYSEFTVQAELDTRLTKILFQMVDNDFNDQLDQSEFEDFIAQSLAVGAEGFDWLSRSPGFLEAVS